MKRIIVLGMILMICAGLTACGKDSQSTADEKAKAYTAADENRSATTPKHFSSLEEYVDYVFSETDDEVFLAELMTYRVYAEQDTLVYDYTYEKQYAEVDDIKKAIDGSYDPENQTVKYLLDELRSAVDLEHPKVKYIYRNNDGTIITEQIYQ